MYNSEMISRDKVLELLEEEMTIERMQSYILKMPSIKPHSILNAIWRDDLGREALDMYNQLVSLFEITPKTVTEWPIEEGNIMVGKMK